MAMTWLAVLAVIASRWLLRPAWPDDYDAIGFVRAVERFDIASLQPHFPGYPVYVALAKAAHAIGLAPLAIVGPRAYVALGRAHVAGHFAEWGGSIATRPDIGARLYAFVRDLFYDGIAPSLALAAFVAALAIALVLVRPSRRALAVAAL